MNPKIQSFSDSNFYTLYKFGILSETRYIRDGSQIGPKTKLVEAPLFWSIRPISTLISIISSTYYISTKM